MDTGRIDKLRVLDQALIDTRARTVTAVRASKTSVTDVYGVGPIGAAIILGHSGDIRRFPTSGHYARHNGTASLEASSGPKTRHRLNPRGDRQLNHAIYTAALTQIAHDTAGRVYYERKQAEAKTKKEAMRALKRRISDVIYPTADQRHPRLNHARRTRPAHPSTPTRPRAREDNAGTALECSVTGLAPHNSRLFG